MKNKKFLVSVLSAAAVISLAACGGKGTPSEVLPSEETSVEPSEEPSATIDYGTVSIADINLTFMNEMVINPVFSKEEYEEDLSYSFDGHNISIEEGKVKGLVPETETVVTASSEHFTTTFKVTVNHVSATLSNETGAESKFAVATPNADNYILHFDVSAPTVVNDYTRLSSFAFNGSNNSWYNIEMGGDGSIQLFARFNGVEKYFIYLGNRSELSHDGVIEYKVDIFKKGQVTRFYFNNRLVCGFDEVDMAGYAPLSSMEVTAAADRANAGLYVVNLNKVYYELEDSQCYIDHDQIGGLNVEDVKLAREDGGESKYSYGDLSLYFNNFIYSTTVDMPVYDTFRTRPVAFAFNGSDNSWYNIETNEEGGMVLYGRFNGVEKYHIYLGNMNDMKVNGAVHFTINIMKKGQATWYFFNDKLVCWFTETELQGYAKLSNFEVTAATDVWREGDPYEVYLTNTKIQSDSSETYQAYMSKVYGDKDNVTLASDNGAEQRLPEIAVPDKMVYSTKVVVNQDSTGWFRPSAFAFNNSDNSWYNIETDDGGAITLFARFNGHEKYFIPLGNKADNMVDGKLTYEVSILKEGQATYFFFNGELKASFAAEDLAGYAALSSLNITSCADRAGSAFEVMYQNQKVEDENSQTYQTLKAQLD